MVDIDWYAFGVEAVGLFSWETVEVDPWLDLVNTSLDIDWGAFGVEAVSLFSWEKVEVDPWLNLVKTSLDIEAVGLLWWEIAGGDDPLMSVKNLF